MPNPVLALAVGIAVVFELAATAKLSDLPGVGPVLQWEQKVLNGKRHRLRWCSGWSSMLVRMPGGGRETFSQPRVLWMGFQSVLEGMRTRLLPRLGKAMVVVIALGCVGCALDITSTGRKGGDKLCGSVMKCLVT